MAIAAGAVVMREPLVPPKSREVRAQYTAGDCALFIVYGTGNFGMLKWVRGIDSGNPYSKRDSEGRVTFGTSVPTTLKHRITPNNRRSTDSHIRDFGE